MKRFLWLLGTEDFLDLGGKIPLVSLSFGNLVERWPVPEGQFLKTIQNIQGKATRARLDSSLARLSRDLGKGDLLIMVVALPMLQLDSGLAFACYDSDADDLPGTSLALADLIATLRTTEANLWMLIDHGCPDEPGSVPWADDATEELNDLFADDEQMAGLVVSRTDLVALVSTRLKKRFVVAALADVLDGNAPEAADAGGGVRAENLADVLSEKVSRFVRQETIGDVAVEVQQLGKPAKLPALADIRTKLNRQPRHLLPVPLDIASLSLHAETFDRVKNLKGFRKGFQVPDAVTPSSEKFVARMAYDEVKKDIDDTFSALREHLGYKRADMQTVVERDGQGFIRAPGFSYTIAAQLDPDDPSQVVFRRSVHTVNDLEMLSSEGFRRVFGTTFDRLMLEVKPAIDMPNFIDKLESNPPADTKLEVSSSGERCKLLIPGWRGEIDVEPGTIIIQGRAKLPAASLVEQFLKFYQGYFGQPSTLPALPG